ncbi:MAG: hypothetical protein R2822_07855 [Spirosomataceae bacterium]
MAAQAQLNYAGHTVTLFERADQIGDYYVTIFLILNWRKPSSVAV